MQLQDCFSMFAVEKSRNAYTALCVFFFCHVNLTSDPCLCCTGRLYLDEVTA
jgi:hypothetical protein